MFLEWSFVRNATSAKQYGSRKLSERKNLDQILHLDYKNETSDFSTLIVFKVLRIWYWNCSSYYGVVGMKHKHIRP